MSKNIKVMNSEQAFNFAMNAYPSLYASSTIEEAKIKYFGYIFNTNGNGYRDLQEFIDGHIINKHNKGLLNSFPNKYIGDQPLYDAYTKINPNYSFPIPDFDSRIEGLYTSEELEYMPEIIHKVQSNKKYTDEPSTPYPNFSKEYSMVWRMDMNAIDKSWTESAIWFYENIKKFFESEDSQFYHGAVPKNEKKLKMLISDYEKSFERQRKDGMDESQYYKAISEAYELEYTGDTEDFINRRWEKELDRIKKFIDETVVMLKAL